jgi:hypothetical protein
VDKKKRKRKLTIDDVENWKAMLFVAPKPKQNILKCDMV